MKPYEIGPSPLGMDMMSDQTAISPKAKRDILNTDVDAVGNLSRRAGARRLTVTANARCLWSNRAATQALCVLNNAMSAITVVGNSVNATALVSGVFGPTVRYFEHGADVYFTDGLVCGIVTYTGSRILGVPEPTTIATLSATAGTTFAPGQYTGAYSYITAIGEESGLSPLGSVTLATTGGISFALPAAPPSGVVSVNLYLTPCNGDIMYLVGNAVAGMTFAGASGNYGRPSTTWTKSQMHGGSAIAVYNGRLYVADGNFLRMSEPFNFGMTDTQSHHIGFASKIMFVAPVANGIFVGCENGVYFLRGGSPETFEQNMVSNIPPAVPDATYVPAAMLGKDFENVDGYVAAWMSISGIAYGQPDGTVKLPQVTRASIAPSDGTISYAQTDGVARIYAIVPATINGTGVTLGENV